MCERAACMALVAEPAVTETPAAAPDAAVGGAIARLEADEDSSEPDRPPIESSNAGEITRAVLGS